MEKVKKQKKQISFMKNVLMLMIAQVAIKVLGFLYRLVIINIDGFGDIGNGYYSTGYQVYSLLLTFDYFYLILHYKYLILLADADARRH